MKAEMSNEKKNPPKKVKIEIKWGDFLMMWNNIELENDDQSGHEPTSCFMLQFIYSQFEKKNKVLFRSLMSNMKRKGHLVAEKCPQHKQMTECGTFHLTRLYLSNFK